MTKNTTTLWRPVGPEELALIKAANMQAFPPRLPEQPIFYPVLNESYAIKIARDWNVPSSGTGFVTQFQVQTAFLQGYDIQKVGGVDHVEYWIPAEDMDEFNRALVGEIMVTHTFS